jgi:leucyl aminopeptidase
MHISSQQLSLPATKQHLLVLGVFAESWHEGMAQELDGVLDGALVDAAQAQQFTGRAKQQLVWPTQGKLAARYVALVGLGKRQAYAAAAQVQLGGLAARLARQLGATSLCIVPPEQQHAAELAACITRGVVLGQYAFTTYKTKLPKQAPLRQVVLHLPAQAEIKRRIAWAQATAQGVALARDWVNAPPNVLYPETFADIAVEQARAAGVKVRVLDPKQLAKRDMNLLLAVGSGSARTPRLVHLSYTGPKAARKAPIALVGKGITFDSGGLCIKTCEGMTTMKMDMGGAATVLATVLTAARLKLPIAVHGILALAENMPSSTAFRCGDVIRSAAGTTIEINNTDAEGRLVLADALHYTQKEVKPAAIVDLATLTGACMVALGPHTVGLFANDDGLAARIQKAAQSVGEDYWRMPLTPALRAQLNSEVADMRNTGERYGGAITAALFLQEFVGQTPWAHMDIAGPAWTGEDAGAMHKGGTGVGVATLLAYLSAAAGAGRDNDRV